ncbi:MAG: hypothetical protein PWP48_1424 [Clostridiales bacterium]|jgi:uncharacterized protein YybS (DUF2232 family)|nr:hypothetical protein [Clostridiales bacterium]
MSDNKSGRVLLEVIGYGALAALLCRALVMAPLVNFVLLLTPTPFIMIAVRRGWLWSAVSIGVALAVLYLTGGVIAVLVFAVLVIPTVVILAWFFKRKSDAFYAALASSVAVAVAGILLVQAVKWATGREIFDYIQQALRTLFSTVDMNAGIFSMLQPQQGEPISPEDMAVAVTAIFKIMLPSMIMILSLSAGFINMMASGRWLKKYVADISDIQPFHEWALPNDAAKGLLSIAVVGLLGMLFGISGFDMVFATIIGVLNFIFAVQGLATLDYIMIMSNMGVVARIVLMILNFVIFQLMLTMLGVAEQIFHIRRNIKNRYDGGMDS